MLVCRTGGLPCLFWCLNGSGIHFFLRTFALEPHFFLGTFGQAPHFFLRTFGHAPHFFPRTCPTTMHSPTLKKRRKVGALGGWRSRPKFLVEREKQIQGQVEHLGVGLPLVGKQTGADGQRRSVSAYGSAINQRKITFSARLFTQFITFSARLSSKALFWVWRRGRRGATEKQKRPWLFCSG